MGKCIKITQQGGGAGGAGVGGNGGNGGCAGGDDGAGGSRGGPVLRAEMAMSGWQILMLLLISTSQRPPGTHL